MRGHTRPSCLAAGFFLHLSAPGRAGKLQNLGGVTVTVLTSQFTYTSRTLLSLTRTIDISVTRAGVTGKFDPSGRSSCITRWRQVVLADSDAVGYEYWLLLLQLFMR